MKLRKMIITVIEEKVQEWLLPMLFAAAVVAICPASAPVLCPVSCLHSNRIYGCRDT